MTEPRRDQASATAAAVFGTIGRTLVRTAAYLGPLLLETGAYGWRLLGDAVHGARMLWLRYRTRKAPARAAEYGQIEKQLRDTRVARWATWRAIPAQRRLAVRAAALAILVAAVAAARARYPSLERAEIDRSASHAVVAGPRVNVAAPAPAVDLDAAATRFQREARAAAPGQWTFLTDGPVLAPGARGEFDDFLIASPWVMRETERGNTRYRMWYRGCYFRGRDRGCGIGHATSPDGIRWEKTKGPVFEPADSGERRRLHGVTVVRSGDRYFLWYSVTPELFGPWKPSTLHLATSSDGLRWEAGGQVLATIERRPHPMEPAALHDGRQFHLWYLDSLRTLDRDSYVLPPGAPFLMHFTSPDGRTWQEAGRFPVKPTGLARVRAVVEPRPGGGFQAMGFENERLVRFVSSDGSDWDMDPGATTTIEPSSLSADVMYITDATALESGGGTFAWFVTKRQPGREEVRVGFRKAK